MNWLRVAAAFIVPLVVATGIAALLWGRRQMIIGNVVGATVLCVGFLIFCGIEYTEVVGYRVHCQQANLPCPPSNPSDFVRLMTFGFVATAQIMALFVIGDVVEGRARRREVVSH